MDDNNYNPPYEEDQDLDLMSIVRQMWAGRKTILICTGVFIALGLLAAFTMKRTYSVSTVMVPQMSGKSGSSLSSLAALAGVDMGVDMNDKELSPLVYPEIVSSIPFRRELIYTPLHWEKVDEAVDMYTYYTEIAKPSFMSNVKKYTIGLPFTILGALRKEKPDLELPGVGEGDDDSPKPLLLTDDEEEVMSLVAHNVSLTIDKKEGILTLNVNGSEPVQTAELALKAQELLENEITRFRTDKARKNLEYIQARFDETKNEAESLQASLAAASDRSQDMVSSMSRIQRERIQQRYAVANAVYTDMAKQLEQAKLQVKRDTPVLTVIQPVSVPLKPSNSRLKTLVLWTFVGLVLGCGIVFLQGWLPKLKAQFNAGKEAEN